ncbi:MAG: carotenoid oxygenase family protein [Elainella sp. C42_A2020_010]|nr:carotenoid oxygenase family protein [Elainella sp. C42_A2020_010]
MKRRDFLTTTVSVAALTYLSRQAEAWSQNHHLLYSSQIHRTYPSWASRDLFLQGINAPVFQEVDLDNLPVTGEIPPDLAGMYVRNGPNPMFQPIAYAYPLEGDGMLHAVYFEAGKAKYRNRWILTKGLIYEMQAKQALPELRFRNYANTHIIAHAGKLLALYETGLPYEVSRDLETIGEWSFNGKLEQAMTAHPKLDVDTGELHFYRYSFFTEPYLTYYVANAAGEITRTTGIELPQPALLHDMALSDNYAIFCHCPLVFDFQQAMRTGIPLVWQPEQGARIGLIHRHDLDRKPIWIETEAFWVWHFMNAFEQNGTLVVDCAYYPQMILENTLSAILSNRSRFQRLTINLDDRTITQQALDDRNVDFPSLDRQQTGKPYRFGYMPHMDLELIAQKAIPNYFPELIQYDLVNQTSQVHRLQPGCYCGEATVVPKSNATSATDHYVLTWVFNEITQTSDLLILDAVNFTAAPLAQIHLPVRVPMGTHGSWIFAGEAA